MRESLPTRISGNIYVVLLLRIALVYGAYALTRLLFYLFNADLFSDVTSSELISIFTGGIKFDTSAILYTNLPVILLSLIPFRFRTNQRYQQITTVFFYVINFTAITLNMIDSVYYRFTLRRTTTTVFSEFKNESNGVGLFFQFVLDYWYVALSVVAICTLLFFCYRKIRLSDTLILKNKWIYYTVNSAVSALIVLLCIGGMRGGFKHSTRPITLSNASVYVEKPQHRAIVLNTPFSLIRTIGKAPLEQKHYFNDETVDTIFTPVIDPDSIESPYTGRFSGRNVMIIVLESFGKELIGSLNRDIPGYTGYTPFLDTLTTKSYVFTQAFANGRKSIDALPSALTGIPSMEVPFILSSYSGNNMNSVASLLREKGYYSAFFHGAPNGSMGFDAFVKQAGYNAYFGKNEYNNDTDFDGIWGIWDEPFIAWSADQMSQFKEPFVSTLFTLSSHHPFRVPEHYAGKFPSGNIPLHQCAGYTDHALSEFFKKAAREPWFNRTVFVLVADHTSGNFLPEYKTGHGNFAIPIIIYTPGDEIIGYNDSTVVQQCDILPTLADLTGYDKKFISFGQSMFDTNHDHFAVNCADGTYQIIWGNYLLQFVNEQSVALFDYRNDKLMTENLLSTHPDVVQNLENKLKAYIQQYNARMIDNKLTVQE